MPPRLSNTDFDKKIAHLNILRLEDYEISSIPIKFKCNICSSEWSAAPHDLYKAKYGCPTCAGRPIVTNEIYDKRISFLNIRRLSNYLSDSEKIDFEGFDCFNTWSATAGSLYNAKKGCPRCGNQGGRSRSTFKDKKTILYYIYFPYIKKYKIGITTQTLKNRFKTYKKEIVVLKVISFDDGALAFDTEQRILLENKDNIYKGVKLLDNGNTELFNVDILEALCRVES